ncbi:VanZ family protein [Modestobacter sp. VKM Ac-2977]|uniref:VanZ family protein n=1 Tax=Modestobacter sp. VKM Ac-2977 TaxID=3004131 RepID=UPI0022AAE49B|nr:VanZ family protein [Modestobacter sp. VKM Ac-2977]MCZ2820738.1 VanZ family protein [Modestobacter sp. VKM Ac-2977]
MTTTHHLPADRAPGAPSGSRRTGLLVLAAVAVLVVVGGITLGPTGFVADARRAVVAGVEALAAPWPGTVHRAQVEAVANALLFVPVGALAALVLRRSGPVAPLALGAATSVLIELAQTALPGRVPDLVDVAANTAGTLVGVALTSVCLAVARRSRRGAACRARRGIVAALVTAPLLIAGVAGCSSAGPSVPPGASALAGVAGTPAPDASGGGAMTVENGHVPDGEELSAFADVPAITGLDDALRTAVQDAARDATADGMDFHVSSGWRSAAYQQALFDAAVEQYGSPEAAREWVLRPDESSHVTGDAVDIGPTDAMYWLSRYGSDYGLCQTYGNEMWHYELAVERGGQCPAPAADPTAG